MKKRIISILLVLCILMTSLLSMTAPVNADGAAFSFEDSQVTNTINANILTTKNNTSGIIVRITAPSSGTWFIANDGSSELTTNNSTHYAIIEGITPGSTISIDVDIDGNGSFGDAFTLNSLLFGDPSFFGGNYKIKSNSSGTLDMPCSSMAEFSKFQSNFVSINSVDISLYSDSTGIMLDDLDIVPSVPTPTISSASYDAGTGILSVTGTNFQSVDGLANDIVASKLTLIGEGGSTRTLSGTPNTDISSATSFSLTLSAADKVAVNMILNKNGFVSTSGTAYLLSSASGWNVSGSVGNTALTISNVPIPTLTSATYNFSTGTLVVSGTNLLVRSGVANDIDVSKLSLKGEGGATCTLTASTPNVDLTSATNFTVNLSQNDKLNVNSILNKNGTSSQDGTTYNISAAEDWAAGADSTILVADLSGNSVTVSNVPNLAVSSVSVPANGTYAIGQNLDYTVNFSTPMNVVTTNGTPYLTLTLGSSTVHAAYFSGTGGTALVFRYTIVSGDSDSDGVSLNNNITLNGGVIKDADGNPAGNGTQVQFTGSTATGVLVDGIAPAAPSAPDLIAASDSGLSNTDNITKVTTPTFTGTAEANSTVTLYNSSIPLGTTTVNESGLWSITVSELSWGTYNLTAKAKDSAGNLSAASEVLIVEIDIFPPAVGGVANNVKYNRDVAGTFTEGTATLSKNSEAAAPYLSGAPITEEGSYVLVVTDAAGNSNTVSFSIDRTAPTVGVVSDGGLYNVTVSPTFNEGTATLAKDGGASAAYSSGTPIAPEGEYVLVVKDGAGNTTTVSFTIDKTPPAVGGITNNGKYNIDVAGTFTEGTATLSKNSEAAAPYMSGASITDEGSYVLVVTDAAGNSNTVSFTIDRTAPTVGVVNDGGLYNVTVSPTFNEGTASLSKDGGAPAAYSSGTPIAAEGNYVLVVIDGAGNSTTISFTIDKTPPSVAGITNYGYYFLGAVALFGEGTATLTKNSEAATPYLSNTFITDEGSYVLVVTDAAGNSNTLHFAIDRTAPTVGSVTNGGLYNVTVAPTFSEGTATLSKVDGASTAYTSGTPIAAEGVYFLGVIDDAGNMTTVSFTIDKTPPAVGGVTNNGKYNIDVAGTFTEGTATLSKNSEAAAPYLSSAPITEEGSYVLVVTDTAGNSNTVSFTIDRTAPTVGVVSDDSLYNATVSPTFNEGTATLAKDGETPAAYTSGTPIAAEGNYTLMVTDDAGNTTTVSFTIDKTAPAVGGIANDAAYNSSAAATFTEGTATLSKNSEAAAPYLSGAPITEEGSYVLVVTDAAGNSNTISFTIDNSAPTIMGVTAITANGSYSAGDTIIIKLAFSEAVTVTGTPQLSLETGSIDRVANYTSGSGTNELTFTYTVQPGDISSDLDYTSQFALTLNGGTICDAFRNASILTLAVPGAAGSLGMNKAIVIDTTAPSVISVSVPSEGIYIDGNKLEFTVNFNENVIVTGTPQISLVIGTDTVYADFSPADSSSTSLKFVYIVTAGQTDTDGIAVGTLSLNNGGTINDTAGTAANLTLSGLSTANILVDASAPNIANDVITVSDITSSSVKLKWNAAADIFTPSTKLKYKVVYSRNNIATLSAAESATQAQDWTENTNVFTVSGLTANTEYYFNVLVKDEAGNKALYTAATGKTTASVPRDTSDSGGTTSGSNSAAVISMPVFVNGKAQDAGTSKITTNTSGQSITTISIDDKKLDNILQYSGDQPIVTLPGSTGSDIIIGEMNGQTLKNMSDKAAVLEIKTDTVTYTLPVTRINIDSLADNLGGQIALKDIKISIKIAESSEETVRLVNETADKNKYMIVVKPVEFDIICTSGQKTFEVKKFNSYVERTIAIPDGLDPSKITTGIVLNSDGTSSHVPTQIIIKNNKYYAKINSLTNSTYSVIYNPVSFTDVSKHWAKDAINDMGSRMVVSGVGNGKYDPTRSITRAEFAAIIVRALGLTKSTSESSFKDVSTKDWFNGYIVTAMEYGLISGHSSESFGPNEKITREQAMTILANAMRLTGLRVSLTDSEASALLAKFTDGKSVSQYAKTSVAMCLKAGIITGSSPTTISPKSNVTRAEVAVMIQNLLRKSKLI